MCRLLEARFDQLRELEGVLNEIYLLQPKLKIYIITYEPQNRLKQSFVRRNPKTGFGGRQRSDSNLPDVRMPRKHFYQLQLLKVRLEGANWKFSPGLGSRALVFLDS